MHALYHIYFGELVAALLETRHFKLDLPMFLTGNILPGYSKYKQIAHRYEVGPKRLLVPDFDRALEYYARLNNTSLFLGVLGHLFLDKYFTEDFLKNRSSFIRVELSTPCALDEYLAKRRMFTEFEICHPSILKERNKSVWTDGVIDNILGALPKTGFKALDELSEENWFEELKELFQSLAEDAQLRLCYNYPLTLAEFAAMDFCKFIIQRGFLTKYVVLKDERVLFEAAWPDFRQAVIDVLLQNPQISKIHKRIVGEFLIAICETNRIVVDKIVLSGVKQYQSNRRRYCWRVLRRIYEKNYVDDLNDTLRFLASDDAPSGDSIGHNYDVSFGLVQDLIEAFVAASSQLYRLAASHSAAGHSSL